ncbi:DNA-binding IclR family transcriptional regulator [Devosia sp. 2618]
MILELVDQAHEPLGIREIARQTGLSTSIVQRIVNTFAAHNFLRQDEATRRYVIGYRAFSLGSGVLQKDRLLILAQEQLHMISQTYELNGYLGTLHNDRALYLLCVQSPGPVAIRNNPGELAYLHSTAMGKVLLADLDDTSIRSILYSGPLFKATPSTIVEPERIIAQVKEIRDRGYASVVDETILGVVSVGAPIRDVTGHARSAISVAYAERSSPHLSIESVAPIVVSAAEKISRELGWDARVQWPGAVRHRGTLLA